MSRPASADLITLTPRDVQTILMVYSYWGLPLDVIHRALWQCTTPDRTTCYRRLKQLTHAQYLQARSISAFSPTGASRLFFTVGKRGLPIIAHHFKLSVAQRRRASRIQAPANIVHHTGASHFRLSVELAAQRLGHVTAEDWKSEIELAKAPVVAVEASGNSPKHEHVITNIADRAFRLSLPDQRSFSFLVEMDRDTMTKARMRERLRGYLLHARAGPESAKPVLWVVPHQQRQDAIVLWAKEEAAQLRVSPTIFALATTSAITEATVLSQPIWQVPNLPLPQTLLPADVLQQQDHPQQDEEQLDWLPTQPGRRVA